MTIADSYNFRRISELVTTSGVVGAKRLAGLGAEGYDAVVNLLPDDSEYAVPDEAAIVAGQGLGYVYIPVDFEAPSHDDLEAFGEALGALDGRKVHVHCAANFRVSAFYGLYALRTGRFTARQADELVGGLWDPSEHPAWKAFIDDERARITGSE